MVILDTSILIDALRKKSGKTTLERILETISGDDLAISVLSIQELYQGKSVAVPAKEADMQALLAPLKILPYSYDVAKRAGEIVREKKYEITFADAAIAATAIINACPLATLDKKDFIGITGLEFLP